MAESLLFGFVILNQSPGLGTQQPSVELLVWVLNSRLLKPRKSDQTPNTAPLSCAIACLFNSQVRAGLAFRQARALSVLLVISRPPFLSAST